jgi:hypothetical protein
MKKSEWEQKINEAFLEPQTFFKTIFELELPKEYERKIDRALEVGAHNDKALPRWVRNIRKKLDSSIFRIYQKFSSEVKSDNSKLGFAIGAAQELREYLYDNLPKLESIIVREVDSAELGRLEEEFTDIISIAERKEKELINAPSVESAEYHHSKAQGLRAILDDNKQLRGAKEDTKICLYLLLSWPVIQEKVRTRRKLYEILLLWFGQNQVGDFKRVEKLFERIKFKPAKVGRPKKP